MPLHPISDDSGKLADLKIQSRIAEGFVAEKILIDSDLRTFIGWIKAAIQAHLAKEVKIIGPARIHKNR